MDVSLVKSLYMDRDTVLRRTEFLSSLPTPDRPRIYLTLHRTLTDVFLIRGKTAEFWMSQLTSVKCGGLEYMEFHFHPVVDLWCMVLRQIVEFLLCNYF